MGQMVQIVLFLVLKAIRVISVQQAQQAQQVLKGKLELLVQLDHRVFKGFKVLLV
jgi:hypothetical protein